MRSLRQDVRHSLRLIKQKPLFAAVTVLTLALGIGANTAIFSILNALVLRNLPVWRPDRLVEVAASYRNSHRVPFSFAVFQLLEQNQRVFSSLIGWTAALPRNLEVDGALFPGGVRGVTGNYYGTLGARPLLGRLIGPQDAASSPGMPVAVIGYEFWSRRFGRDRGVIGKVIRIEGTPFTVVGVSRKWFTGMTPGTSPEITIPITAGPFVPLTRNRAIMWIFSAGRLEKGFTVEQARAQLRSFWHEALVATAPTAARGQRLQSWLAMGLETKSASTGINADLRAQLERPLRVLIGLASLILLVACVNLANLTLARLFARTRDISVRIALGATRLEIVRQLLTETFLLSAAGALVAFVFANWGGHLLLAMIAATVDPVTLDLRPDWRVFLFTALAAVGTGVLIALAPAWQASRQHPVDALRGDERTLSGGAGRLSKCLIVTQIALSLVLVFGAGLLLETFASLRSFDPHFERKNVLALALHTRPEGFTNVDTNTYRKQLIDAVVRMPGVSSAGFADLDIPAGDTGWTDTVSRSATDLPADNSRVATLAVVSPGFFATLGISLVSGRNFDWTDDEKHPPVAILAHNLARRLFPYGDELGARVRFGVQPEFEDLQVIGVASSARLISVRDPEALVIYVPSPQHPRYNESGNLFVRSENPTAMVRRVENEIQSHGHEYSVHAATLAAASDQALVEDRTTATLSGLFAGLALALAGIGLFGLMSYMVTRRTREIGIRMAVGAQRAAILRLILRESVLLCVVGIILGVPCAVGATRLIAHMLFGVAPGDPLTFVASAAVLLAVGAVAGYWPAHRAAKTDLMAAVRCE